MCRPLVSMGLGKRLWGVSFPVLGSGLGGNPPSTQEAHDIEGTGKETWGMSHFQFLSGHVWEGNVPAPEESPHIHGTWQETWGGRLTSSFGDRFGRGIIQPLKGPLIMLFGVAFIWVGFWVDFIFGLTIF